MKKQLLLLAAALTVATSCVGPHWAHMATGSKHSPDTDYPSYDGLVMAGYQGWFHAPRNGGLMYPDPRRIGIDAWPDVSEYAQTYPTGLKLADGSTARFFSSDDKSTVDLHFKWMKEYGLDGVFVQRFYDSTRAPSRAASTQVLRNCMEAASKYDRAIAVMYDLSGLRDSGEECTGIISDWKYLVDSVKVTDQPGRKTYLHQHGKPVVVIWGVGFPDRGYNIRKIGLEKVIDFLHNDPQYGGCVVMLGVPTFWRNLDSDCTHDPYLHTLIKKADMLLPWTVQRFSPLLHNDMNRYHDLVAEDIAWCKQNNIDYVPCVYPGFSWHNLSRHEFPDDVKPVGSIPRQGGRFYWQLITTAIQAGGNKLYVAMFDEVNEGTAIFKVTDNPPVSPDCGFINMDGKPSDQYLWLTGEAAKLLRKEIPMTKNMPVREDPAVTKAGQ